MNIKVFAKSMALVVIAVLTGCSSKDSSEFELSGSEQLRLVRKALAGAPEEVREESLPVWLSEFIDRLSSGALDQMRYIINRHIHFSGKSQINHSIQKRCPRI